jgi:hypothetical protein
MRARVDRLGAGDLATLWAEEPITPFHIGLGGLLDPGPLVDEHGQLQLQELRAAVGGPAGAGAGVAPPHPLDQLRAGPPGRGRR